MMRVGGDDDDTMTIATLTACCKCVAFMVWWFTVAAINIHTASAHIICDLCVADNNSSSHTCKFLQLLILRAPACIVVL